MISKDSKAWFHSKSGSGVSTLTPNWKGWIVTSLYMTLNIASIFFLPDHLKLIATIIVNVAYVIFVWLTNDGTLFNQNIGFFLSMIGTSFFFIGLSIQDGFKLLKIIIFTTAIILTTLSLFISFKSWSRA